MMKLTLWVVAALLLAVIIVLVIGYFLPSRHVVSRSESFRATPEQLFALICGSQQWRPDVLRSEPVLGTPLPTTRETLRNGESVLYEVTESAPPLRLRRRIASTDLPYGGSWLYSLAADGDATRLTITEEGEVYNPVFRFMARFIFGLTANIERYLSAVGDAIRTPPGGS